jgi:Ras-related GTP-binding protein C/D
MNCRTFQESLNEVFSRSWEQEAEAEQGPEQGSLEGAVQEPDN